MTVLPRSSVRGIEWPAVPDPRTSTLIAMLWQLEASEWWTPEELARHQQRQLAALRAHAAATVPFYEDRLGGDWSRVPIATRDELIAAGPRLLTRQYPATHGAVEDIMTSRTSGEPVRLKTTAILGAFWSAITLRDHRWHRRDLGVRLAAIRHTGGDAPPPDGQRAAGWGPATEAFAPDAPLSVLSVASTTEEQLAWLVREDPAYLLIYPTVLDALLRRIAATGARLPSLRQVRTISEALPEGIRARCREVLGVPLVDTYSAQEVGYIALECPAGAGYHVQAERLLVEILAGDGTPCRPGEIGRVVVTDLHNFATPILRYDLGDYAEVGAACPCGRGLPVLTRIVGRRRGMLTYPDGRTVWPVFTVAARRAARYREIQLVQETVDRLRARVVPDGELDARALVAALHGCFGHPFAIEVEVVERLARSPAGKLEEFVSRLGAA
jgi:phenylacetate-CoA ligase